jgi:hypothetical protein
MLLKNNILKNKNQKYFFLIFEKKLYKRIEILNIKKLKKLKK